MLVRLGQQSAVVTWPFVKVTPESMSSLVTFGITGPGRSGDCVRRVDRVPALVVARG